MKRILFLTLTAALFTSCERPTGLATREAPVADLTAATSTTFSGDATVLRARVLGLPIVVGEAGPVPEGGGAEEFSLLSVSRDQTGGLLAAEAVHATVVAQGNSSSAEASVASASLTVAGNTIQADLLRSQAQATCDGTGQASASGSSEVAGLVINSQAITVSGQPNDTVVNLPGLTVVINEQSGSANSNRSDITVNALHVTAFGPLGQTLADVVISSAHADISCGACPAPLGDFVTGGGWITGPSGGKANFGVAGGIKNDGLWGHLTYIDHGSGGVKVKGTGVTSYEVRGSIARRISGTAEIDGVSGTYTVDVTDAGEPGRDDTFSITLSTGYVASGKLAGGNIQLHAKPNPCP